MDYMLQIYLKKAIITPAHFFNEESVIGNFEKSKK